MRSACRFLHFPIPAAKRRHLSREARQTRKCRFEALELRTLLIAAPLQPVTADPSGASQWQVRRWSASPSRWGRRRRPGRAPPSSALTPQQIRTAYGFNLLSQDGAGQTIAIVDAYDNPKFVSSSDPNYASSDLHYFNAYHGLPDFGSPGGPTFTKLDQHGGSSYPSADAGQRQLGNRRSAWTWSGPTPSRPWPTSYWCEANDGSYFSSLFPAVATAAGLPGVSVVSMSSRSRKALLMQLLRQLLLPHA